MTQRKADETKSKPGRKKLTLSKETLKDLTANASRANPVRGGARVVCSEGRSSCHDCTYVNTCHPC